jgi:hypothetical protein
MTREEFKQYLKNSRYLYIEEGNKIIINHKGNVFFHRIKTIPHDIVFDNNGLVHLSSLETIPSNILFSNKGNVYLDSLRNIPKEVVFDNRGSVNLPYGWNHNWDGNIEGICYDILFNKMISLGLFDR